MNDITSATPRTGFSQTLHFAIKWTPRAIVAGVAGYYSLGIAYEKGIMAAIDRAAIYILRRTVGYAGIGALMPTFQWYSAWAVRVVAALSAGIVYDLAERAACAAYAALRPPVIKQMEIKTISCQRLPQDLKNQLMLNGKKESDKQNDPLV